MTYGGELVNQYYCRKCSAVFFTLEHHNPDCCPFCGGEEVLTLRQTTYELKVF